MKDSKTSIALGTWSWGIGDVGGNQIFGNHFEEEDLKPVFDEAIKNGLNLWDTAFIYGMGAAETILGKFIKKNSRKDIVISTKFTPRIASNSSNPVAEMFNTSLERLGTNYIDIYWIHSPADVERWTPFLIPMVKKGQIKRVGVSNHNLEQLKQAESILSSENIHISAVQNHYSLIYRSSEKAGILDYCTKNNIEFFSYLVLEQGALSGKYNAQNPLPEHSQRGKTYNPILEKIEKITTVMDNIGKKYNASSSQVAIAWAIAKGTTPIIGVTKVEQVKDAAKAQKIRLTTEDMGILEEIAKKTDIDTIGPWEKPMV